MKRFFKLLFVVFLSINLFIVLSGRSWLYKAISITYLKGHTSSYINDFVHFPSNKINAGKSQDWLISKNYNKQTEPKKLTLLNKKLETVAFMIVVDDSIRFEKYWDGYSSKSMSNSFSMAKSWVSTLIGVAIKEGKIKSVEQRVGDFLDEFKVGEKSKITIKHLLTMSSGLDWSEGYYNPLGQTAEAYYGNNLKKLVLQLNSIENPGEIFKYHSSCTQILSFVLESAVNKTISEYLSEKLWIPLGANHSATWSIDKKNGDEKAFCCINSNARDFARIGKLYLKNGNWNGVQIIDTSYVKEATTAADLLNHKGVKNINYGYQFWITNYKNLHIYYARGLWGQYVICIPEKNMIIVRLGKKFGKELNDGHWDDLYKFIDLSLEMCS